MTIIDWTAVETANKVRQRVASADEVLTAHLRQLAAVNPELNAVTRHNEDQARADAAVVDDAIARGDDPGLLAGVPVTIKDNVDVANESTPNGLVHLSEHVAALDNPAVAVLRDAGAVILGRTNTPEFSWRWHTDNPLFGPTLNPMNSKLTPGGSSGGAAAALAAGIGCLALGNDAGGSVRWPASCTGTAALRPTVGRIASHNASAPGERPLGVDLLATQGPMARTIADVELMYRVQAAPSWRDPNHVPVPASYGPPPKRVGIHHGHGATLHPAVEVAMQRAADAVTDAGFTTAAPTVPDLSEAARAWATLINADFAAGSGSAMEQYGSEAIQLVLSQFRARADGSELAAVYRAHSLRAKQLREWSRLFIDEVDVLVMPVAMEPAWPAGDDLRPGRMGQIFDANTPMVAINLLGLPAAAVGVGLVDGVPVGVQVVGPRFGEAAVLSVAAAIEAAFPPTLEGPEIRPVIRRV